MTVTGTTRFGLPNWGADTDTFTRLQMDAAWAALESLAAIGKAGPIGGRPAFGPGDQVYFATDQGALYYDTGSAWEVVGRVVAGTQVIMPVASQIASLTEWRDLSGSVLGRVDVAGTLFVDKLRFQTVAKGVLQTVTPQSGLTNFSPAFFASFGYRLTIDGWCEIQGMLATNGATNVPLSLAGALPSPADSREHTWIVRTGPTGPGGSIATMATDASILASGQLIAGALVTDAGGYVNLDGIRYYVGG